MVARRRRSVSIVDVARVAGVSHQTVSRVLNNPKRVRAKTLSAVQEAIRITGYRRNENARMLRSLSPETIGILVPPTNETGPVNVMWAVEQAAAEGRYMLRTAILNDRTEESCLKALNQLLSFGVAAVIIVAEQTWQEPLARMTSDLPLVSVGASIPGTQDVSYIDMDQQLGVRMIMQHMAEQGCRRIDFLNGPDGWYSSRDRLSGWAGFSYQGDFLNGRLYKGDWSAESGYRAGIQMAQDAPDALIAANDEMAIGAMRALMEQGLRVPQDVKISGYDDLHIDSYLTPSLTSIHQDFDLLAHQALQVTAELIDNPDMKATCSLIKPKLIVRESSTQIR